MKAIFLALGLSTLLASGASAQAGELVPVDSRSITELVGVGMRYSEQVRDLVLRAEYDRASDAMRGAIERLPDAERAAANEAFARLDGIFAWGNRSASVPRFLPRLGARHLREAVSILNSRCGENPLRLEGESTVRFIRPDDGGREYVADLGPALAGRSISDAVGLMAPMRDGRPQGLFFKFVVQRGPYGERTLVMQFDDVTGAFVQGEVVGQRAAWGSNQAVLSAWRCPSSPARR